MGDHGGPETVYSAAGLAARGQDRLQVRQLCRLHRHSHRRQTGSLPIIIYYVLNCMVLNGILNCYFRHPEVVRPYRKYEQRDVAIRSS